MSLPHCDQCARYLPRACILAVLLLGLATSPSFAQVRDDVIVDGPVEQQVQVQRFVLQDEVFDQWLYGSYGSVHDVDDRLNSQLAIQIADIENVCKEHDVPLTALQKKKLELAARGDIERFKERVEKVRAKFDEVKTDQNRINEIFQDIQPLQLVLQTGLFGDGSLFQKTLLRVLTAEQQVPHSELIEERRAFRYRAQIGITLAMMESSLPLMAEQRQALEELLASETPAPKRFSQYDYYYVMLQIAKLPPEKISAILDKTQLKLLQPYLEQARGMEAFLKQQEEQLEGRAQVFGLVPPP